MERVRVMINEGAIKVLPRLMLGLSNESGLALAR